jgi:hypothetical protein
MFNLNTLTCLQPNCSIISGGNTRDAKARLEEVKDLIIIFVSLHSQVGSAVDLDPDPLGSEIICMLGYGSVSQLRTRILHWIWIWTRNRYRIFSI